MLLEDSVLFCLKFINGLANGVFEVVQGSSGEDELGLSGVGVTSCSGASSTSARVCSCCCNTSNLALLLLFNSSELDDVEGSGVEEEGYSLEAAS